MISILFIIRLSKIEDDIILSLVGKEIIEFSAQASQNGELITVTDEDINCPDDFQAFNIMAILNLNITHTMIEGGMYQDKVKAKGIMAVPTVCKDQEEFTSGRTSIEQIVENSTTHLMLMLSLVKVSMMFWLLVVVLLETVLQFMLPVKNLKLVF